MKLLKVFTALAFFSAILSGCQKELSFDGNCLGNFKKDAGGDCLPVTINGIFQADTVIKQNANYVDVEVLATIGGSFEVKSDTVNGYFFYKSGNIGSGSNTIRLYASGKPIAAGNNVFTIKYGTSTCRFTIPVAGTATGGAIFTLTTTLTGDCSGATVNGTYTQGIPLTAGNSVTLQVNVTQLGTYTLGAASTNGMVFTSTGTFTATGIQNVTLSGSGLPITPGISNATATNGTSSCTFSITVLPAGTGAAVYSLSGTPGTCTGATQNGTYIAGTPLTATNTVTLNVTVISLGTYSITTTSANGISFSKTGSFIALGPQPVILNGTGTPIAALSANYTATAGITTCIFSVVCGGGAVVNNDYFPTTGNSWWNYNSNITSPDTLFKKATILSSKAGNSYRRFDIGAGSTGVTVGDSTFYRKSVDFYYQYISIDSFSTFYFDVPQHGEILFLKENTAAGATWVNGPYSGTVLGVPTQLKYSFTIISTTLSLVVNGVTYNNVIQVDWKSQENVNGAGYIDQVLYSSYYAKGVGLIKYIADDQSTPIVDNTETLRSYQVF
jgi:hypothetical protein